MIKVTLGVLVIGSLLNLFGESKNPQQIETLTEKHFAIKEIKKCSDISKDNKKEYLGYLSSLTIKQLIVSDKNEVAEFKDGSETKYIICKDHDMFMLEISTKVYTIKDKN